MTKKSGKKQKESARPSGFIAVAIFAVVAVALLAVVRASSRVIVLEVEQATSSNATVASDSNASGTTYTKFAKQSGSEGTIKECSNPTVHSANPGNIFSVGANAASGCHLINMSPGLYRYGNHSQLGDVTFRCTQRHQCAIQGWNIIRYNTIIIEGMKFGITGGTSTQNYQTTAYYGKNARYEDNIFDGTRSTRQTHGISIKNTAERVEIFNNSFNCVRHCIEISQNGNVAGRFAVTNEMVIRGNTFTVALNGITNRGGCNVTIDNNTFTNGGTSISHRPFWAHFDGKPLLIPKCPFPQDQVNGTAGPIRTRITNNTFNGGSMSFAGRGVADETIYFKGNKGSVSCKLTPMSSDSVGPTIDEQTTAAPKLASGSDPC